MLSLRDKRRRALASGAVGVLALLFALASCSKVKATLPDLSGMGAITVVVREEGSGTRDEFAQLAGTAQAGAKRAALSTDQVIEAVAADENAIGYVAFSALDGTNGADVALLSVEGVDCSAKTIASGSYPLERQYILAYSGEVSELVADFISYTKTAGQAVASRLCTPVHNAARFLSNGQEGSITIAGSSSMQTLMAALVEDYGTYNPHAVIVLEVTDSTAGLNAAMRGQRDLAMSSRSLKDYEAELLTAAPIAADGIAVIVNAKNPLRAISLEQLRTIYDGKVTRWGSLGS